MKRTLPRLVAVYVAVVAIGAALRAPDADQVSHVAVKAEARSVAPSHVHSLYLETFRMEN